MPLQLDLFRSAVRPANLRQPRAPESPTPPPTEPAHERRTAGRQALAAESSPQAPASPSDRGLKARLKAFIPISRIVLTNNRSSIITARQIRGQFEVRIHRCFEQAPDDVLIGVASFLRSPKRSAERRAALHLIRQYFQSNGPPDAGRRPRRAVVLRPVGRTLDLRNLRDEINQQYFDGKLSVDITWGRAFRRRSRRRGCGFSVRLGTYTERDQLVRIHRCLDQATVPQYVVAAVVYHEMLHAAIPPVVKNGRRHVHTREFRRRERLFQHHQRAERWIDRNLEKLIRAG